MKTEFMTMINGIRDNSDDKLIVIGTTNRPDELDEAIWRWFPIKIYIPLPDDLSRKDFFIKYIENNLQH